MLPESSILIAQKLKENAKMRHFCWFLDNLSSAEKLIIFAKTWKIEKNPVWELVISTPGFPDFWNIATISNSKYFFKGQTTREKVISLSFSIESYLDPVGLATVKLKNSFVQWASQTGSLYSQWCFLLPIPLKQT